MVSELSRQKTVATQCANRTIYGAAKTAITTNYLNYLLSVSRLTNNGQNCAGIQNNTNNNNILTKNKRGRKCYICSSKNHLSNECPQKPRKPKIEVDAIEKYKNIIKGKYINELMRDVTPYIFRLKAKDVVEKLMEDTELERNQAIKQVKDNHYKVYKHKVTMHLRQIMKELHQKYNMKSKYNGKIYNYLKGLVKNMTNRKIRNSIYNDKIVEVEIEERKEVKRRSKKNKNKRCHAKRRYNKIVNKVIKQANDKFIQNRIDKIEKLTNDLKIEEAKIVKNELQVCKNLTTFERKKIDDMLESSEYRKQKQKLPDSNKKRKIEKKTKKKSEFDEDTTISKNKKKIASQIAQTTILNTKEDKAIEMLKNKKILELTPEECEEILKKKDEIEKSNDDNIKMRYKMVEERYSFFVSIQYFKVKAVKIEKDKENQENKKFRKLAEDIIFQNVHKPEDSIKLVETLFPNQYEHQLEYLEIHDKEAAQILVERAFGIQPQNHETSQDDEYYIDSDGEYHRYDEEDQRDEDISNGF